MSLIDVTSHPLLTGKVTVLVTANDGRFEAQQDLAEALLGLTSVYVARLTAEQLVRAKLAVALQLNFQVEQGLDPFVVQSESSVQQGESRTYRPDAVHPQALAIINAIELSGDDGGSMVRAFADIPPLRSIRNPVSSSTGWT